MTQGEGPSRFRPGSWDIGLALGFWILFLVVMALGGLLLGTLGVGNGDPWAILAALPAQLCVMALVPMVLRYRSSQWREDLGLYSPAGPCLLRGIISYLWVAPLWWGVAIVWMTAVQWLEPGHKPEQDAMELLRSLLTGVEPLWVQFAALFITTIGAAASEELLFRGLLQGALRRFVGKQTGALALGAFFGIVHMQPDLIDSAFVVPPLAFLGYLLSLVRESPGGLWACILIHATNNGLAILFELYK